MRLEPTIYTLPIKDFYKANGKYYNELTDEEFIEEAEQFGSVYSLSGFQEEFNTEIKDINNNFTCMRIIWRRTEDNIFGVVVSNYTESEKYIDDLPII